MCVDSSSVSSCHTERAKKKLARTLLCQPINKGTILIASRKYFQINRQTYMYTVHKYTWLNSVKR